MGTKSETDTRLRKQFYWRKLYPVPATKIEFSAVQRRFRSAPPAYADRGGTAITTPFNAIVKSNTFAKIQSGIAIGASQLPLDSF